MQVAVNFFTPGVQKIYAVNEDTGRDLRCFADEKWFPATATCKLYVAPVGSSGLKTEVVGSNVHVGNLGPGDLVSEVWKTAFIFQNIPFSQDGLHEACVEVTQDGKTITSLPFYLEVERSIQ